MWTSVGRQVHSQQVSTTTGVMPSSQRPLILIRKLAIDAIQYPHWHAALENYSAANYCK
jgi:hypothetical protein